ncbi:MAG: hypothetical protein M1830_010680 [Pleopsidium flavum]|nr:MAG: hypothetical protein M1830_010680 [Pleopsidium flavum]
MAKPTQSNSEDSSKDSHAYNIWPTPSILASCYTVNTSNMALKGFHYSSAGAGGMRSFHPCLESYSALVSIPNSTGIPEVPSGIPSPPLRPSTSAYTTNTELTRTKKKSCGARGEGPAYTITEECGRLFCETLKTVFLGERTSVKQDLLVTGTHTIDIPHRRCDVPHGCVSDWLEIWDYAGDIHFRGFVADKADEKSLFIFFDDGLVRKDLKRGLMALIELASDSIPNCTGLIACLNRSIGPGELTRLMRDLGWVGFKLVTLDRWSKGQEATSKAWVFLGMEL